MLKGVITAMITPFQGNTLDEPGLVQNIHRQLDAKIDGLVFLGTTGEAMTLTPREQKRIIEIAASEVKGKVPLIIGTGTNCTRETIERTQRAKSLGADFALVVTPYYNKPTQLGIYEHFKAASDILPLILYNNPSRTIVSIELETILKLARLPGVVALKESPLSPSLGLVEKLHAKMPHFPIYAGDDALTLSMIQSGSCGVISVLSNLFPEEMMKMTHAALQALPLAEETYQSLSPFFSLLSVETNPIPIKALMDLAGYPAGSCRLPLTPLDPLHIPSFKTTLGHSWSKEIPIFSN